MSKERKSAQGIELTLGGRVFQIPRLNLGQIEDLLVDVVRPDQGDTPADIQRGAMRRMRYVLAMGLSGLDEFKDRGINELAEELRGWTMSRQDLVTANDKILIDAGLAQPAKLNGAAAPGEVPAPAETTATHAAPT